MLALADQYLRLVDFSAYYAVSCLDSSWPTDPGEHLDAAGSAATRAPRFGEAIVNDYLRCAVWPTDADPLGAITAEGTPPILVVSTTGDPATPYENGVTVADRLAAGVLLAASSAVAGLDRSGPTDPVEHLDAAGSAATRAPRFGEAIVNDYLRCAVWPTDADPLGAITAEGTPPILVVSTTGDPATPYENGVTVADRLAAGVLLTTPGAGPPAVPQVV